MPNFKTPKCQNMQIYQYIIHFGYLIFNIQQQCKLYFVLGTMHTIIQYEINQK